MNSEFQKSSHLLKRILTLALILFFSTHPIYPEEDFLPARVKDISNRAYEPAVIELLDGAKESIVIAMYTISLGADKRNPIRLLLNDLVEARGRLVSVTVYLNTRFKDREKDVEGLVRDPIFKRLQELGAVIHLVPSAHRLHDKLIIVDNRYIVEGSTNWSISALRDNFESATLIDSPQLAKMKLLKLESMPLQDKPQIREPHRALYLEDIPKDIILPKLVLLDKRYLPEMVSRQDSRSMDLYLVLLAHSQNIGKDGFFIDMESMALSLGMPHGLSDTALRRQAIKSLKKLKDRYRLVDVKFFHGKDAWVELQDIQGDDFAISSNLIKPGSDEELSMRLKFLLIIKTFLESQGEELSSFSGNELARRFHVNHTTMNKALKELR